MKIIVEISLRETRKACEAIEDCNMINDRLNQIASNEWESDSYDEVDEDECNQLIYDIEDLFSRAKIEEYEINKI